ncbi:MAG: glycoside hydrolase family 15 protein [Candidatus Paceibacterota bacterium]
MPRSLALGNGNMLICLDVFGRVKDFYYPYVGLENHTGAEYVHKLGIFVDGHMSWISDQSWSIFIDYQHDTMASAMVAKNTREGITLYFEDVIYNEKNVFLRHIRVENNFDRKRTVKIFFNQQFNISEVNHASTAYYDPDAHAIIHYKGRRVFLVNGRHGEKGFDDFTVGLLGVSGKEGTWKDAEDGELTKNPIEHGSVDSTVGFTLEIEGFASDEVMYWFTATELIHEAIELNEYVLNKKPQHLIETTIDFWYAWAHKRNFTFEGLTPDLIDLFKKSLFIIRTHVDNRGSILASGDSDIMQYGHDAYAYSWPRDGAYVSLALDKAGYNYTAKKFYEFCNKVITPEGYLLHKYRPDHSVGSSWHPWWKNGKKQLAIQEDETALVVVTLWDHYRVSKDLEFIEEIYNSFIKHATEFFCTYVEEKTRLPLPSYDLWEEKHGISTYTACVVYGALNSAAQFARLLGKEDDALRYENRAGELKEAILTHLYNPETKFFDKLVRVNDNGELERDTTIDVSSFYGLYRFGVLDIDEPKMREGASIVYDKLQCKTRIGGIVRYEGDKYFKVSDDTPGNPWFVTTLWMVRYEIARAKNKEDMERIVEKLGWTKSCATSAGMLSEQLNPHTGDPMSVAPLTWSHAEYVLTIIAYLEKMEELGFCSVCYPVREE